MSQRDTEIYNAKLALVEQGIDPQTVDWESAPKDRPISEFVKEETGYSTKTKSQRIKEAKTNAEIYGTPMPGKEKTPQQLEREAEKEKEKAEKKQDKLDRREYKLKRSIRNLPLSQRLRYELATKKSQKLRPDRLAKKELRVKDLQDRLKRLKKADRASIKLSRQLSKILNKKRSEETIQTHSWNVQQTGNILHTPNYFASRDAREHSFKTNNHILRAQNLVMPAKPMEKKPMKWL